MSRRHPAFHVVLPALMVAVFGSFGAVFAQGQNAEAEGEVSAWDRAQERIEAGFAQVNDKLIPVLFVDVTFGVFDPSAEGVEADLTAARQRLAAFEAEPAPDARDLRLATKTVDTLEAQAQTLAEGGRVYGVPLIVVFLLVGGVFFTLRFGFVNLRLFGHSIAVIRGRYDNPDDHGEVSHFQALTAALSATVGLGNIAGVAIAISQGGAGAVFWMWFVA
ncbi:MAG: alanine:cation symporter family protein, partial [Planctomycetota bacterium]